MSEPKSIFINEEEAFKRRLALTPTERFDLLMRLIKINKMLKDAEKIEPKTIK